MTIEQKRRELFEAGINIRTRMRNEHGDYVLGEVRDRWAGFNAALDAVVIELPNKYGESTLESISGSLQDKAHDYAIDKCRAAIESAGLGLKVLP